MRIFIVHIQTESSEHYYYAYNKKPTDKQIEKAQRWVFDHEGFSCVSKYCGSWKDLVSVQTVTELKVEE